MIIMMTNMSYKDQVIVMSFQFTKKYEKLTKISKFLIVNIILVNSNKIIENDGKNIIIQGFYVMQYFDNTYIRQLLKLETVA